MKYLFFILSLVCFANTSKGQIHVNYDEPGGDTSAAVLRDDTTVFLYADPRLETILKHHKEMTSGGIYTAHGYRLQIYSGNDRNKATELRVEFIRRFPGVHTYMSYIQPQFRVKVGDYRSRQEAQQMYHDAGDLCNPCMIVPDIVVINTFKE